jgi:pimeloyl-ACP methyl ester carboxylesterase
MVLAHGFGGSARNFRAVARRFRARWQTVLYDARGHARSAAPTDPTAYELDELIADFRRVADATEASPIVAGGLSLGAATALGYASRHPATVRALVLAAYPAGGEPTRQWALGFADAIEARGLEAAGAEFVWGARSQFDEKGAAFIRQGFLEHPPHALVHCLRGVLAALPDVDTFGPALGSLRVPTLIVVGSQDARSLASSRRLAAFIPGAALEVIEGAGHVVNLSAPRAFERALERFFHDVNA